MTNANRQITFAARPTTWVGEEHFALQTNTIPTPGNGEMLVRNLYMSVDPYMRGMMNTGPSYAAALEIGDVLSCRVVGQVVTSNNPDFVAGDFLFGMLRWEEYSIACGHEDLRKINPDLAPISWHLGVLGAPGLTAWVGMMELGQPKAGETVFVSAASGAVGQIAGQLARLHGARVVGSAGSDAKLAYVLDQCRYDAGFNYKSVSSFDAALAEHCPNGIDVYFDNVGGAMLDAVLLAANEFARLTECGMISQYNLDEPRGIHNLALFARKRLKMQGFIVRDHYHLLPQYLIDMAGWQKSGEVTYREDIAEGLEAAPSAFIRMLKGENFGKQVVQIATV
ncbi:MAG: NADP-dependent oxidoreductase [Alphaproteobacteria bacterium]|nr:NADP-dependent oxidoreductase [Alphaproteobacteria bacterium]